MAMKKNLRTLLHDEDGSVYPFAGTFGDASRKLVDYEIPRKLFHASGAIIPLGYLLLGISKPIMIGLILPATIFIVLGDLLRMVRPTFNAFVSNLCGPIMRKKESRTLTTSTYFLLAALFVTYAFDKTAAIVALLFLSFGDPIAALIGKRFGEIRLVGGKSLEGTVACFQVCFFIALLLLRNPFAAVVAGVVAALAELLPLPVNDNIRIPVFSALALSLLI